MLLMNRARTPVRVGSICVLARAILPDDVIDMLCESMAERQEVRRRNRCPPIDLLRLGIRVLERNLDFGRNRAI